MDNETNPVNLFGSLTIARYQFTLLFAEGAKLPKFPALALRGLLGWSLQETVCPFLQKNKYECKKCIVRNDCPYFCLYEQQASIPGLAEAPKGYMLYSPPGPRGQEINLNLTLFGKCHNFLPAIMEALFNCGRKGLGNARNCFKIISLQELTPARKNKLPVKASGHKKGMGPFTLTSWLNNTGSISQIRFVTPLRLRKKGKYISKMDWPFFYSSLGRRLEGLNRLYGDGKGFGREKWLATIKEFDRWQQPVGKMKWHDLSRYSSRQCQKVPLGGLVGNLQISNIKSAQNLWLQTASLTHVGKGAVMGLGRIETE